MTVLLVHGIWNTWRQFADLRTEQRELGVAELARSSARYWIQHLGGRQLVRRFVSIAGSQRGTLLAYVVGILSAEGRV